jgi:chromate transporter
LTPGDETPHPGHSVFAYGVEALGNAAGSAWLHGLKIAAVAVVAQAVLGMMRSLAPDKERATLAVIAAVIALSIPTVGGQVGAIAFGGIVGFAMLRNGAASMDHVALPLSVSRKRGYAPLPLLGAEAREQFARLLATLQEGVPRR